MFYVKYLSKFQHFFCLKLNFQLVHKTEDEAKLKVYDVFNKIDDLKFFQQYKTLQQ